MSKKKCETPEERIARVRHEILKYVCKDTPIGFVSIDPGNIVSGVVLGECIEGKLIAGYTEYGVSNTTLLDVIERASKPVIIELPVIYTGSKTVGDTLMWTGRFYQQAVSNGLPVSTYTRSEIRGLYVNKNTRIQFPEVNQYGHADAQIIYMLNQIVEQGKIELNFGTPKKDAWQALALAYYHLVRTLQMDLYYTIPEKKRCKRSK